MGLAALIEKERKELLSERTILLGIILSPLILLPFLGLVISVSISSSEDGMAGMEVFYVDKDLTELSSSFLDVLGQSGLKSKKLNGDIEHILNGSRPITAIIIPEDFSEKIRNHVAPSVRIYVAVGALTTSSLQQLSLVSSAVQNASKSLGLQLARADGVDFNFYETPFTVEGRLVYRGRVLEAHLETLSQFYITINVMLPLVILMTSVTAGSVAATSVGLEKEAKTLETLLTMPISRIKILLAKLLGSVTIAFLGMASFMVGIGIYLYGLTQQRFTLDSGIIEVIGITPVSILFLGLALGIALLITLGIGILAGVLAGDVRGGQQLAALLQFPIFLAPLTVLQFVDFSQLPATVAAALLLDPITHVLLALREILAANYPAVLAHLVIPILFMAGLLALSAWLFRGERLITMKVSLRRKAQ